MDKRLIDFLSARRSVLIAPAGYGKTTILAEALKYLCPIESKPILVLTHTHAGVASIKKKCATLNLGSKVEITTISGFCQKIVHAFDGQLPPSDTNGRPDFNKIMLRGLEIMKLKKTRYILGQSYSHLIADEYQDCSYLQHIFISLCAFNVSLHILADPLQAIFGFNNERMVNFSNDFKKYEYFEFLNIPWRWYQDGNNKRLGDSLRIVRERLNNQESIDFNNILGACHILGDSQEVDFWIKIRKKVSELLSNSLLIIFPNGFEYQIDTRAQKKAQFDLAHQFTLLESIDDKAFYRSAKDLDKCISSKDKEQFFANFIRLLNNLSFKKGDIEDWFNRTGVKRKTDKEKFLKAQKIKNLIEKIISSSKRASEIDKLIKFLRYELVFFPKRQELLSAAFSVLRMRGGSSMYDNMILHRNRVRIIGRKVEGKCIGTTLLTKGLEFEDVIIIDAHKIKDENNLYVALTRASKRLFIYSSSAIWAPK